MIAPMTDERARYDFHMHSRRSYDSLSSARAIVASALARGLAGIAVTDHGTIAGSLDAKAAAGDRLLVVTGAEIHSSVGDLLCLFIEREIRSTDARDVIAEVHEQGGVVILPHPLRSHPKPIPDDVLAAVDGVESINSRAGHWSLATGLEWQALAGKPLFGGSDAHFASEIGRAWTMIDGPVTENNLRSRILAGRTVPGGVVGPPSDFYKSQLVKLVKTGDVGMLTRLGRRLWRRYVVG